MLVEDDNELVQKTAICHGLSPATLQSILDQSDAIVAKRGHFFFREGDLGDSLYVVRSGTVIVQRRWGDQPIVLARVGSGDCFGEMSLIDLQRRFAAVKAETDCEVIRIPYTAICRLCQTDLEQYAMVMMNLSREVSRRLRIAGERLFRYQQELDQHWFDDELSFDA